MAKPTVASMARTFTAREPLKARSRKCSSRIPLSTGPMAMPPAIAPVRMPAAIAHRMLDGIEVFAIR
ncbi:hypothetical protein [Streptomyces sp. SPB162]|uniref:hypothetical protein n=1 Tax=Streptomyces sp. SPB162 TaxID=2940560 RepID=UPI002404E109|nr:hypothetical protein [Streptomyces sp. SPB162]MDF9812004.1 hypothetical protein [Streptomyces sp. SPB162]